MIDTKAHEAKADIALANIRSPLVSQKKNQHENERFSGMKYVSPIIPKLKYMVV